MRSSSSAGLALALLASGLAVSASAQVPVQGSGSAVFTNPILEANSAPYLTGVGTNDITFGDSNVAPFTPKNELSFVGNAFNSTTNTPFKIGTLNYFNGTAVIGTVIDGFTLNPILAFTAPSGIGTQSFSFNVPLTTTPNVTGTQVGDADFITLPTNSSSQMFTVGGQQYTLELTGFQNVNTNGGYIVNTPTGSELHVFETALGTADLYGELIPASSPVPESSTALSFGALLALAGLALVYRRKKTAAA